MAHGVVKYSAVMELLKIAWIGDRMRLFKLKRN